MSYIHNILIANSVIEIELKANLIYLFQRMITLVTLNEYNSTPTKIANQLMELR